MILGANGGPACDSRIRKSAHPDPTPAKEVYFPFFSPPSQPTHPPTHPPNNRICIGLPRGDRLLAFLSPRSEGERAGCQQRACWGPRQNAIPGSPRKLGGPRVAPPVLPHLHPTFSAFHGPPHRPPQGGSPCTLHLRGEGSGRQPGVFA